MFGVSVYLFNEHFSKNHILIPLGMLSTSFYLTPNLKDRAIQLSFRGADGKIVPWDNQYSIIEADPSRGLSGHVVVWLFNGLFVMESPISRRGWRALFVAQRLPCPSSSLASNRRSACFPNSLTTISDCLRLAGTATNPILNAGSVHLLFEPSITSAGADILNDTFGETDMQFGCGLCINTKDRLGKRRKGSGWCELPPYIIYLHLLADTAKGYGWANTYHFLDPESGVALVFGTQLVPTRDVEVLKLWDELEGIFYNDLSEPMK